MGLSDNKKKTWGETLVVLAIFVGVFVVLGACFFVSITVMIIMLIVLSVLPLWLCVLQSRQESPSFEQQLRSEFWVYMGYQNEGDENIYISKVFAGEKRYSQLPREDRDHRWRDFYSGARRFLRVVFSGWR